MKVSEAFLVNTKNFDNIIDAMVKYDIEESVINADLLERLGYTDPNDLLVIRLLKDLNIINNQGKPGPYYEEFQNPDTTEHALAKGLVQAYEQLFESYPNIHKTSPEKIKEAFEELFKGKKTDLIIKYISGTFQKVVSYVGEKAIDDILEAQNKPLNETKVSMGIKEKELSSNGNSADQKTSSFEEDEDTDIEEFIGSEEDSDDDLDTEKSDFDFSKDELNSDESIEESSDEDDEDPFNFEQEAEHEATEHNEEEKKEVPSENNHNFDFDPLELNTPMASVTELNQDHDLTTNENPYVQKALLRKSDLLHKMKRWEELAPTLQKIIKKFDNEGHPELKEVVSRAVIRRAFALLKLNRTDEALPALDTVIQRFKNSATKEFYHQASYAMLYKAQILEKQDGNFDELLSLYNTLIDRADQSDDSQLQQKTDQIYLKRFDLIVENGDQDQVLDASTKFIDKFKSTNKHLDYLQKAMIKRAEILDEMNRDEEALKAYDEFLDTFDA